MTRQRAGRKGDVGAKLFQATRLPGGLQKQKALARLRELDPAACIANFPERAPLRRPQDIERLESGLRYAGMPES
jgi:hypothetical protein